MPRIRCSLAGGTFCSRHFGHADMVCWWIPSVFWWKFEHGKQSISLEPGGQFELSGAPLQTLHHTCAELNSHLYQVSVIFFFYNLSIWVVCLAFPVFTVVGRLTHGFLCFLSVLDRSRLLQRILVFGFFGSLDSCSGPLVHYICRRLDSLWGEISVLHWLM